MSENDSSNLLTQSPAIVKLRRYDRTLMEARPDIFSFEDGQPTEILTVLEENELISAGEEIKARLQHRKLSVQSEEPEFCISSESPPKQTVDATTQSANSARQDTIESNESKDTLTPLDECEGGEKNFMQASLDVEGKRFGLRRRNSQLGRRNSESHYYESQHSLNENALMTKRQFSITQSEPDSENGFASQPKTSIKAGRNLLLHIHAEYTSITDELESMIVSPTNSLLDEKKKKQNLTNPEFAALMEKQHLKECEDNDYVFMEALLQAKNLEESCDQDGKVIVKFI
jgi:hypothetical protein